MTEEDSSFLGDAGCIQAAFILLGHDAREKMLFCELGEVKGTRTDYLPPRWTMRMVSGKAFW